MSAYENVVFLDIETTGLNPSIHVPWEVGIIDIDGKVLMHEMWMPEHWEMEQADPMALRMTNFYKRIFDPDTSSIRSHKPEYIARQLPRKLDGKTLCGAAINFDMEMLGRFMRNNGAVPTWSHRPLDIEVYVAGVTGYELPGSLSDTSGRVGVQYDKDKKHSALYDAWLAREVYIAALDLLQLKSPESIPFENLGKASNAVNIPAMPTPPPMEGSDA